MLYFGRLSGFEKAVDWAIEVKASAFSAPPYSRCKSGSALNAAPVMSGAIEEGIFDAFVEKSPPIACEDGLDVFDAELPEVDVDGSPLPPLCKYRVVPRRIAKSSCKSTSVFSDGTPDGSAAATLFPFARSSYNACCALLRIRNSIGYKMRL